MKGRPWWARGLALGAFVAGLSCSPSNTAEEGADATSPAGDETETEEALMQADRDFAIATRERGVDGWLEYFAPDGAMIVAGIGEVKGHVAIRELMGPFLVDSNPRLLWEPVRAGIGSSGDLGYTIGSSRREERDSANTLLGTGMYLTVWRLQPDGTWKVEVDIGTYTPVTPEP
jgi:ketosteroid isomerase-like protein